MNSLEKIINFLEHVINYSFISTLFLFIIAAWAVVFISLILCKVYLTITKLVKSVYGIENKLKEQSSNDRDKKIKDEIERSINKFIESENLFIFGKYLTIIISGLILVLIVVIAGLILIAKIK